MHAAEMHAELSELRASLSSADSEREGLRRALEAEQRRAAHAEAQCGRLLADMSSIQQDVRRAQDNAVQVDEVRRQLVVAERAAQVARDAAGAAAAAQDAAESAAEREREKVREATAAAEREMAS
eukprot:6165372-Pleurochrysis_carterae.AAC.1